MAAPAIIPSAPFFPRNYANVKYVDNTVGLDTNDGSYQKPWKTLTYANSVIGGSGSTLYVLPGTYSAAVTWTALNVDIIGMATQSGLANITGRVTFSHASSSVRCSNLSFAGGFSHSGAGNLYLDSCRSGVGTTLAKAGAGYFETVNCDLSNSTSFAISAGVSSMSGGKSTALAVTNAAAVVGVYYSTNVILPSASAGTLFIGESNIFAVTSGGTAVTTTGTAVIFMRDCLISDSVGALAKVSLAGAGYSLSNVQFAQSTSTLTAPNLGSKAYFDNLALYSNIFPGNVSVATNGGTTTLALNSPQWQTFTGTFAQTVKLPAITNVTVGTSWVINNLSSGTVTVQTSAAVTISTVTTSNYSVFTYTGASTNGGWKVVSSAGGGAASNVYTFSIASSQQLPTLLSSNNVVDADRNLYSINNTTNGSILITNLTVVNDQSLPGFTGGISVAIPAYSTLLLQTTLANVQYLVVNISNSISRVIAGGVQGSLPYQTAANTTEFVPIGLAKQVLTVNPAATEPTWANPAKDVYLFATSLSVSWITLLDNTELESGDLATVYNASAAPVVITFTSGTINNFTEFSNRATSTTFTIPAFGCGLIQVLSLSGPNFLILTLDGPVKAATNLAGGVAGVVPYQTGVGATNFTAAGTVGQFLQSNGTAAPTWENTLLAAAEFGSAFMASTIDPAQGATRDLVAFTLPSAGTWEVNYTMSCESLNNGGAVQAFITTSSGTEVLNSGTYGFYVANNVGASSSARSVLITTTGAASYILKAKNIGQGFVRVYGSAGSPPTGGTGVTFKKISGFLPLNNTVYTFANLPSAVISGVGSRSFVTDSSVNAFNTTVAGGGANKVPVFSDGTNWKVG